MKKTRSLKNKLAALLTLALLLPAAIASAIPAQAAPEFGEDAEPNPSGAYLKYVAVVSKPEGDPDDPGKNHLAHSSTQFKKTDYIIEEGDMLEYDVRFDFDGYGGFGAVDADISGFGPSFRDAGVSDQNGVDVHIGADIRAHADGQWYHRVIPLGFTEDESRSGRYTIGRTLINVQFGTHPSGSDEFDFTVEILYDNIVITNNGVLKYVIFREAEDFNEAEVRRIGSQFVDARVELCEFTPEELQQMADEKEAAIQASVQASEEEASRQESRAKAQEEASKKASEEKASRELAEAESREAAEAGDESGDGPALALILGIVGGLVVIVVIVVVIFAVTGSKKKKP